MEQINQKIRTLEKVLNKDWRCLCVEFNEECEGCQIKRALSVIKSVTDYEENQNR